MTLIVVTGGCGFIGHHFVEHVHRKTDWNIVVIDKLTYASKGLERLRSAALLSSPRVRVFTFDLAGELSPGLREEIGAPDYIVHMAADTHVDNSIRDPVPFVRNNVMSTLHMLEWARELPDLKRFFYFSTDEVYGSAPGRTAFREHDRHAPTNPYSASKSAAEQLCTAYENTYKIPVIVMNVMNAFGERQHVEKFIPKVIKRVLADEIVEIHADPSCENPGSRFYIHARNIASAVMFLIEHGTVGDKYNVVGEREMNNLEMATFIAEVLGKELRYTLVNFHEDRPGHDLRYCLDGSKLIEAGWNLPLSFEESLRHTIEWTIAHKEWLEE